MKLAENKLKVTTKVHFRTSAKGKVELRRGFAPPKVAQPKGRVPKISRLMALAIRFEGLLQRGEVKDYAELARLGHVSRARVTQIMNLLCLAPDIQEQLLFLPPTIAGRDALKEWQLRAILIEVHWTNQRSALIRLQNLQA